MYIVNDRHYIEAKLTYRHLSKKIQTNKYKIAFCLFLRHRDKVVRISRWKSPLQSRLLGGTV